MKRKILSAIALLLLTFTPALIPTAAASAACKGANTPIGQVERGLGATASNCDDKGVIRFIRAIVLIMSIVVGIAAIIMIVLAGFKYITSAGDAGRVGNAKNTLIYALVGLIIAAIAQFLVHFVLHESYKAVK